MKKLKVFTCMIVISISILFSTNVSAEGLSTQDCQFISILGQKIMKVRQSGAPMGETLAAIGRDENFSKLVFAAYEYPVYTLKAHKNQVVEDFKNEILEECMKIVLKIED